MIPKNLEPTFLDWMRNHDDSAEAPSVWTKNMERAAGVFFRDHRLDNTYETRHRAVFVYIDLEEKE